MGAPEVTFTPGTFVRAESNGLGVGKVRRVLDAEELEIEYFDSIAADGRHQRIASLKDAEPVQVSLQRRCYWQEEGGNWRIGRVVWQGEREYGVRPPDSDVDVRVSEPDLYVRWNRPISDPTEVLVAGGHESPHFHVCRLPFVETVTWQRAASHGIHSLLSSVVELHEHQIEVVRRVLEDPLQRYLLADEVGLGKTIEAGLIIRQYLLDNPSGHVVVIAPPFLRRQWVSELRDKFLTDDFNRAVISVLSHDNPDSWKGGGRDGFGRLSPHRAAGLLVVDEVHHLAADATSELLERRSRFDELAQLARKVPRLLLLSATPLLNNEATFLAMLHLLDPEVHALEDIAGFRRRVRDRRELSTTFFTFRGDAPSFLLKEKIEALRRLFPDDERLLALLNALEAALEAKAERVAIADAVTEARIHISETYRLHRRLLRTRRTDHLKSVFPVRGREQPTLVGDPDPRVPVVQEWLDNWRDLLRSHFDDAGNSVGDTARLVALFCERGDSDPAVLLALARFRLDRTDSKAEHDADLSEAEARLVAGAELVEGERPLLIGLLEALHELAHARDRATALAGLLSQSRRKVVVFTTFTPTALRLSEALSAALGERAVATHLATATGADVEAGVDRFRDPEDQCRVLVCDRSAEEGRNFQFADLAVHYDLPFSPNRLEQRIGRMDRYGRGEPVPAIAFSRPHGSIGEAWFECLASGFGIFNDSVATLQFAIDRLMPELISELFDTGAEGLRLASAQLPVRLRQEREEIAEQDALDSIEVVERTGSISSALDELEDLWFAIQTATEGWVSEAKGNLRFHRVVDPAEKKLRTYLMKRPGQGTHINSMPLVAWDVLRGRFQPTLGRQGTYFRRAAVMIPGTRLFRVGEPFIDALASYTRWDDRGQTFAFWRVRPQAGPDDIVFYRFDYVVEADTTAAQEIVRREGSQLDPRVIQRRADAFLAPFVATIWTDLEGDAIADDDLLDVLSARYDPERGDANLSSERRWALEELVGEADWENRCRVARSLSEQALRKRFDLQSVCDAAAGAMASAAAVSLQQRRLRLAYLPQGPARSKEEHELELERAIQSALRDGVAEPVVRLDSVGALVLSSRMPQGQGFSRSQP